MPGPAVGFIPDRTGRRRYAALPHGPGDTSSEQGPVMGPENGARFPPGPPRLRFKESSCDFKFPCSLRLPVRPILASGGSMGAPSRPSPRRRHSAPRRISSRGDSDTVTVNRRLSMAADFGRVTT